MLSEIHIRFFREIRDFPDACAEVEDQESDDDKAWERAAGRLVKIPDCDLLDIALLWKTILLPLLPVQQGQTLKGLWHFHNKASKHTTRTEEDQHAKNKHFIAGQTARPRSCVHTAASSICAGISHEFSQVGGRDLSLPPPSLRQMWADSRRETVYRRRCFVVRYFFRSQTKCARSNVQHAVLIHKKPSQHIEM